MIITIEKVTQSGFSCRYTGRRVFGKPDKLIKAFMIFVPRT